MKILNLYAGIGGNRKLWGEEHEITAVENNPEIARIYKDFFPNDNVIVADAHEYLLKHLNEFDFIWSSPPCPTHSRIRKCFTKAEHYGLKEVYPDMRLYEEIVFLQGYCKCKWVVENVISWYDPLIRPFEFHRHYFWSNFTISKEKIISERKHAELDGATEVYGLDISTYDTEVKKRKILRNCVDPKVGLHIFNCAFKTKQYTLQTFK